ncbi:MAG TPA: HEAT repeat domain-containing protein [Planctomycetaceae bacterium]|nr:HEAT repeat domain-containing protein [Planctomycetaceae bacterium]
MLPTEAARFDAKTNFVSPARRASKSAATRNAAFGLTLCSAAILVVSSGGRELRSESARAPAAADVRSREAASRIHLLVRQLDHPRPSVRREAVVRLAELGALAGPAVPGLMGHLQDSDPLVRAHAARAICRIGLAPEPVIPVLAGLLDPARPQSCGLASLILGEIGPAAREAVPALRRCLAALSATVRLHAAEAIIKIAPSDGEALQELFGALEDSESDVRYFAVNALGAAAGVDGQAVSALERALTDGDTNVAAAAAITLSILDAAWTNPIPPPPNLADDGAPPAEVAALIDDLAHAASSVRQMASIRLGLIGAQARAAASAIRDCANNDHDPIVRVQAANALWSIEHNAAEVLPVLVDLLGIEQTRVGVAAVYILGRIEQDAATALSSLHEALEASEFLDRLLLARTILRIDPYDREALTILTAGLHDPEADVRYLSALALGGAPLIHQRRIERELSNLLSDRNLRVQSAAASALEILNVRNAEARGEEVAHSGARIAVPASAANRPHAAVGSIISSVEQRRDELAAPLLAANQAAHEAQRAAQAAKQAAAEAAQARAVAQAHSTVIAAHTSTDEGMEAEVSDSSTADEEAAEGIPAITEVDFVQPAVPQTGPPGSEDPHEGLKPIGDLRASIRTEDDRLPADIASDIFDREPVLVHGWGMRRGWSPIPFGWDAPAVYFKPLYFEDINLERYGIHFKCCQPFVSFGSFFGRCVFLPYRLIAQPPCECIYTLGYERPNNCIPLHCYRIGYPKLSWMPWCSRCTCPIGPADPWGCQNETACEPDED